MTLSEYTTSMAVLSIQQLKNSRFINLTTYILVVAIGILGVGGLHQWPARIGFAVVCLGFIAVYAYVVHTDTITHYPHWYFTVQTILYVGLLVLHTASDAFVVLLLVLTIHAMIIFPPRIAARWVVLFYVLNGVSGFLAYSVENAIGSLILTAGLFLLFTMIGHSVRQTELARMENEELVKVLQVTQEHLHELVIAEERNRMAREIHDGLGHYLTATAMQIQGAKAVLEHADSSTPDPAVLSALGKAETLLQEALADVRRSVGALREAHTVQKPLPDAIADLVAESRASATMEVEYDLVGTPRPLKSSVELTLYRVAQEGLTNVRKHARASHVMLTLQYDPHKIGLRVWDDGKHATVGQNGYGLLGLRERVQLVGGTVDISALPGEGFRLSVEIPS